jgi:magnesium-protoporphyrin IX monomethyl ester (oxidative) cyclase
VTVGVFSGCVLYNEIQKSVTNPDIKAAHALHGARRIAPCRVSSTSRLKDYGLGLDLGDLKRTKAYTYFKPKYIFYATYLSEKIGYARYITIYRQLERHPDKRFHPIFQMVRALVQRRIPPRRSVRADHARASRTCCAAANTLYWIRFFLLAVYATMYVRDHARPDAERTAMGLDATEYDYEVFRITTEISRQVFPVSPGPPTTAGLPRRHRRACIDTLRPAWTRPRHSGGLVGKLQASRPGRGRRFATFVRLYFMPVHRHDLPAQVRMAPAW